MNTSTNALIIVSIGLIGAGMSVIASVVLASCSTVEEVPVPSRCEASCCEPSDGSDWWNQGYDQDPNANDTTWLPLDTQ